AGRGTLSLRCGARVGGHRGRRARLQRGSLAGTRRCERARRAFHRSGTPAEHVSLSSAAARTLPAWGPLPRLSAGAAYASGPNRPRAEGGREDVSGGAATVVSGENPESWAFRLWSYSSSFVQSQLRTGKSNTQDQ